MAQKPQVQATSSVKVSLKTKDEPMTEMKRVPYRISTRQEGDMFDVFSYSSGFEQASH